MKNAFRTFSNLIAPIIFIFCLTTSISGYSAEYKQEFEPDSTTTIDDDFGEFKEFDANAEFESTDNEADLELEPSHNETPCGRAQMEKDTIFTSSFWWILGILGATVVAGFLVRYPTTRKLRIPFLLASVVFLGFYRGSCPCVISSFANTVFLFSGADFQWITLLWLLSLLPITYLFGRVFCGWICHLGALQELLYHPGRLSVFTSIKAVKIMKVLQYLFCIALVAQLLVQQKIVWCSIDPFLSIYQLMLSYNYEILSAILVGLLLITSLISYRPFCRAVCPVGLVLGWIEKIPGASVLGMKGGCVSCTQCSKACNSKAIIRKENVSVLNNEECIMCGECLDTCSKGSIGFFRLSKRNPSKVVCSSNGENVGLGK